MSSAAAGAAAGSGAGDSRTEKRALITGSDGFLGRRLVAALEADGWVTQGYDLTKGCDITDADMFAKSLDDFKPTDVIHLAAVADLNFFRTNPDKCWEINVEGTRVVVNACKTAGVRVLFAATCCGYGNNDCHPTTEDSPTAPTEPYAKSKIASEADVLAASHRNICMRLATFYGENMRGALAPAVFLEKAHNEEKIVIHGDGKQTRTFTYVGDIVSGIVTIANSQQELFQIINVTTEESYSVLETAALAIKITGKEVPLEHGEDRPGQIRHEHILSKRLQSLGWRAAVTLEEGMRRAYESFVAAGGRWTAAAGVDGSK